MIDDPELSRCFQGVVPAMLATCSKDGVPNITYLSQIHYLDAKHVALSRQFFNKTYRNVLENPFARAELYDPLTLEAYRLGLRFDRSETSGPLFDQMSARIDAIATLTGMAGIFKLIGADIYEVLSFEKVEGFQEPAPASAADEPNPAGPLTELRGLQLLSECVNRASSLEEMLAKTLATLQELFGFENSMVLVADESGEKLYTVAVRGYGERGVGSEVPLGVGVIGMVARERRMLSIAIGRELRYMRAIRDGFEKSGDRALAPEIPLPSVANAAGELALPLIVQDRLIGVLAIASVNPVAFHVWHEAFLTILANQIAMGMERFMRDDREDESAPSAPVSTTAAAPGARRVFSYYTNDDCIFVDGEYLIRNVPAKILWKLLRARSNDGRSAFSNRELRLDESLGLPAVKDNLESRLILLKKRLADKCPEVRLVPTGRGRFALEVDAEVELHEKASA